MVCLRNIAGAATFSLYCYFTAMFVCFTMVISERKRGSPSARVLCADVVSPAPKYSRNSRLKLVQFSVCKPRGIYALSQTTLGLTFSPTGVRLRIAYASCDTTSFLPIHILRQKFSRHSLHRYSSNTRAKHFPSRRRAKRLYFDPGI